MRRISPTARDGWGSFTSCLGRGKGRANPTVVHRIVPYHGATWWHTVPRARGNIMNIWKRISIGASALALVGGGMLIVAVPVASAGASSLPVFVHCGGPGGGPAGVITAINNVNSAGGGTIDLAANCNYDFTVANNGTLSPAGANALPVVTTAITINGNGTALVGVAASFRILEVSAPNGNLTLNGMQVTGGNSAAGGGGILSYQGTLVLNNTEVNNNTLVNVAGPSGPIGGGGILNSGGMAFVNNSEVIDNTAPADGGGGILNFGGQLSVINSAVDHNAAINGGGVVSGNGNAGAPPPGGVTLLINNSEVNDNVATCTLCGGNGFTAAGGIANANAATIENSDVNGNTGVGGYGGGILNHGTMTIDNSDVNRNTAKSDTRSEEHTSELQSLRHLVCRLLLEKKHN